MLRDYDINSFTLDNLRNATLILDCDDAFVIMPMRDVRQITRTENYAAFTTNFDIECSRCCGNVKMLKKDINMLREANIEFDSSEELEDFLLQFERSGVDA